MRHSLLFAGIGLLAALAVGPARAQVTILDTNGFEGFTPGNLNGQQGWANSPTWGQPFKDALIAAAPGGTGQAICFDNTQPAGTPGTESSVQVVFPNLTGNYKYATATFDFYREGNGFYNNLWWWPVGNNNWSGLQWDAAAGNNAPTAQILPMGFGTAPAVPMPQNQWVNMQLVFNLQAGTEDAYVNGVLVGKDVNIGTGEFAGWFFSDTNTVDPKRSPNGVGQRSYVDNLKIVASNDLPGAIPEPGTMSLLAFGVLPLLRRRRK